ncbi:aminodeoxychorismate/anthranilate synthase component II [Babesia caballi]|uniref:Aminodeoxychorismate/anthranilate synthase component II n=1 Tax=Babesia caballi TaxID=5871 RepID=A0AAV4M290_BABCB|nr:aminodeoxychorismate/anthranilate synthase component II [Babesia caballi]
MPLALAAVRGQHVVVRERRVPPHVPQPAGRAQLQVEVARHVARLLLHVLHQQLVELEVDRAQRRDVLEIGVQLRPCQRTAQRRALDGPSVGKGDAVRRLKATVHHQTALAALLLRSTRLLGLGVCDKTQLCTRRRPRARARRRARVLRCGVVPATRRLRRHDRGQRKAQVLEYQLRHRLPARVRAHVRLRHADGRGRRRHAQQVRRHPVYQRVRAPHHLVPDHPLAVRLVQQPARVRPQAEVLPQRVAAVRDRVPVVRVNRGHAGPSVRALRGEALRRELALGLADAVRQDGRRLLAGGEGELEVARPVVQHHPRQGGVGAGVHRFSRRFPVRATPVRCADCRRRNGTPRAPSHAIDYGGYHTQVFNAALAG